MARIQFKNCFSFNELSLFVVVVVIVLVAMGSCGSFIGCSMLLFVSFLFVCLLLLP